MSIGHVDAFYFNIVNVAPARELRRTTDCMARREFWQMALSRFCFLIWQFVGSNLKVFCYPSVRLVWQIGNLNLNEKGWRIKMHKKEYNLQYSRCQYYCHNIWDYLDDKQLSVTTVHKLNTFELYAIRLKCVPLDRRILLKSSLSKQKESSVKTSFVSQTKHFSK